MPQRTHALPDGRTVTTAQLAQELGIPRSTFYRWLACWPLTVCLQKRPRRAAFTLADGRTLNNRELAKELGITERALFKRRQRWPQSRITAPRWQRGHRGAQNILAWCPTHKAVYTRAYGNWAWEPLLPGTLDRAREYAQEFGYTLHIRATACPACSQVIERSA